MLRVGLLYDIKVIEGTVRHHEEFSNIFLLKYVIFGPETVLRQSHVIKLKTSPINFMDEMLSEERQLKNGWEYSRWELSGWEYSGGEGGLSMGDLKSDGWEFSGCEFSRGEFS